MQERLGTLPRLQPLGWQQLKAASSLFVERTAKGSDGFHVTAVQHLCEAGLRSWAKLCEACEMAGAYPRQVEQILAVAFPKKGEGVRAIGLHPALLRLTLKARKPDYDRFEEAISRKHFSVAKRIAPADVAWPMALRVEMAVGAGDRHAMVCWDLKACTTCWSTAGCAPERSRSRCHGSWW